MMIQYQEVRLDDVLAYYLNGFKPKKGVIISADSYVDMSLRVVVFKMIINDEPQTKPSDADGAGQRQGRRESGDL